MGENGDSALFLEEKIGRCPHFPQNVIKGKMTNYGQFCVKNCRNPL